MQSMEMDIKRLADMIKDIKFTMLTSVDNDGCMHSRPMATQKIDDKNFDGKLWFFTKKDSGKVHEIEHDQHVNLAYANPEKQHYISVSGRASMVEDKTKMKELWNPTLKAWFPEGLEDPEISLIGIHVESAEIWDAPASAMVKLVGSLKAAITGKAMEQKSFSGRMDLNH